jgi:hypothetical protein
MQQQLWCEDDVPISIDQARQVIDRRSRERNGHSNDDVRPVQRTVLEAAEAHVRVCGMRRPVNANTGRCPVQVADERKQRDVQLMSLQLFLSNVLLEVSSQSTPRLTDHLNPSEIASLCDLCPTSEDEVDELLPTLAKFKPNTLHDLVIAELKRVGGSTPAVDGIYRRGST